ncbi:MAG: hypothetical protein MMC23_009716 [Stictis urceolatum]|nr:hypothetical protein [Stictis urceolata]
MQLVVLIALAFILGVFVLAFIPHVFDCIYSWALRTQQYRRLRRRLHEENAALGVEWRPHDNGTGWKNQWVEVVLELVVGDGAGEENHKDITDGEIELGLVVDASSARPRWIS